MDIKGKIVSLTGSRTGIGWALAKKMAFLGAELHLIQRQWDSSQTIELLALGARAVKNWTCDLDAPNDVLQLGQTLSRENIDIHINNAGILTGDLLENQTYEEIGRVLQVNLTSAIILTRALLPGMLERRSGLIVNNTSVSAIMRFPCASTYAASKAGLLAFTQCLEVELRETGVRTLALLTPGINTDMLKEVEKKYGMYFETPKDNISAEVFANQIIAAIESEQSELLPQGSSRTGLFLARHFPSLFQKMMFRSFSRTGLNR